MTGPWWLCLAGTLSIAAPSLAAGCDATPSVREAGAREIRSFVHRQGRSVLSFAGYSGAGYEDPATMLDQAARVLDAHDPAATIVNIGATAQGIGAVYELARRRGFATIGIVSARARDEQVPLSPCVDQVFFVRDATWGGRLPGSTRLAPTSAAIVSVSREIVAIGGGDIARDELLEARRRGKPVRFIAADMNHRIAIDKALAQGAAAPTDFRGSAHARFAPGP